MNNGTVKFGASTIGNRNTRDASGSVIRRSGTQSSGW